jgi:hypothetical protein
VIVAPLPPLLDRLSSGRIAAPRNDVAEQPAWRGEIPKLSRSCDRP